MFATQPVGWRQYLSLKKMVVPSTIHRYFYVSWEDALWDLLTVFSIPKNSVALIPEFYCQDVIHNMEMHGLHCVSYPTGKDFQTDPRVFKEYLEHYQPQVVIIFHAVGITNTLFKQYQSQAHSPPTTPLLIEDSVHRIVEPAQLTFLTDNHFIIDSLRKVTPLAGSNLYSPIVLPQSTQLTRTWPYTYGVLWWWLVFQIGLKLKLFLLAEKAMLKGYELTGDSYVSSKGWWLFKKLALHVDAEKIKAVKVKQVEIYLKNLKKLAQNNAFFFFPIPKTDYGELRGFPIGLELNKADAFLSKLRSVGLLVRFELNDSLWSQRQKVVYLPLGPHVSFNDIEAICRLVEK